MSRNRGISRNGIAAAVLIGLALALVPVALAAKGGNGPHSGGGGGHNGGGSSTISDPVMVTDNGTPGLSFGDIVTFNVSTTATTTPFVHLRCYQNGVLVADGLKGFWDGSIDPNWDFGLSSPIWQSGAADCTADLGMYSKNGHWKVLASTSFHVDA